MDELLVYADEVVVYVYGDGVGCGSCGSGGVEVEKCQVTVRYG